MGAWLRKMMKNTYHNYSQGDETSLAAGRCNQGLHAPVVDKVQPRISPEPGEEPGRARIPLYSTEDIKPSAEMLG